MDDQPTEATTNDAATGRANSRTAHGLRQRRRLQMFLMKSREWLIPMAILGLGLVFPAGARAGVDIEAAKALARQNNCFKCHGISKEKDGPAYTAVAEKYRGKENAEARLIEHITSGEKAKFPDGHEEAHKIVKTSPPDDMAQIKNLIDWILSL
ncbi:c-type cytochrome [Dokdonella immobilis]|nr:c-type cytochrome [Dokdonella immobilis]